MKWFQWICVVLIAVIVVTVVTEYPSIVIASAPIGTVVRADTIKQNQEQLTVQVKPSIGYMAPSVVLQDLNGNQMEIGGKRERPILLNFWASWCAPCHEEAADFIRLSEKWKGKLDVVGLNATKYDRLKDVNLFVQSHAIPFPILLDPDGKAMEAYRIYGFPTSLLIDSQGIIQEILWGVLPFKTVDEKIDALIND